MIKVPWSREGFIQLLDTVQRVAEVHVDAPVLVHCVDGASQSGLFCAVWNICEKMRLDGEVDVFHTVKMIKARRFHCISSLVSIHSEQRILNRAYWTIATEVTIVSMLAHSQWYPLPLPWAGDRWTAHIGSTCYWALKESTPSAEAMNQTYLEPIKGDKKGFVLDAENLNLS
jgi:Protein-tyrosine phosphatase